MIKINREVTITDKISIFFIANLTVNYEKNKFILNLQSKEMGFISFEGADYYECCFKLREFLENRKLFLLIQAASVNVYPSRMVRDMTNGLQAYCLTLGKKSTKEQLINIFDPATILEVGTISEQENFFEEWKNTAKI